MNGSITEIIGGIMLLVSFVGFPIYMIYGLTKEIPEARKILIRAGIIAFIISVLVLLGVFLLLK